MYQTRKFPLLVVSSLLGLSVVIASCGDRQIKTGRIHDSVVGGLNWKTGSISGVTGEGGEFEYRKGDTVMFSLGSIELGAAKAARDLTVLDIVEGASAVTDNSVTNIARLLQTLDQDGDLTNGIAISDFVRSKATTPIEFNQSYDAFKLDSDVVAFLSRANISAQLRSATEAQEHLQATIDALQTAKNQAPTVNAGTDLVVAAGTLINLSGTATDSDGVIKSFQWVQSSSDVLPAINLISTPLAQEAASVTAAASFTVPSGSRQTLTFTLTATDDDGASASDSVTFTLN